MTNETSELDDKYVRLTGRIFLSGTQALVRLPLLQKARDAAAGLDTAGYVSGYRGSPLGGLDRAMVSAGRFLRAANIHFEPGLNEDLAATAVWGTQQVGLFEGAKVDGVFGLWYGKGPGVDRSMDVLKHANSAGAAPLGGVIVVMGDDHGASSSTLAHQSEQVLLAAMIPVLAPATIADYLAFGLFGYALSRYSGCWVGLKAVGQTVETSATVDLDALPAGFATPTDFALPPGGLNIRRSDAPLAQEKRLHGPRMAAVAAFARANPIDRVEFDSPNARIGIVTSGKSYLDVREALDRLGIDEATAARLGIRLLKLGLTWPIEPAGIRRFAEGLDEILVIEEKRGFIEDQLARILYDLDARPRLIGKHDEHGNVLLPSEGELDPAKVATVLGRRLLGAVGSIPCVEQHLGFLDSLTGSNAPPLAARTPFFCAGCPHNTSTKLPDGSRGIGGIGCHGMVLGIPERRTSFLGHMGGEGAAWIGQSRFSGDKHVFQNLGDGTYSHSGLLAMRAAAAAGVNITYKILYNDAVAMTGGQPVEGQLSVAQVTRQVAAEGARRVVVVTDEPDKYGHDVNFAPGVTVHHRDQLDQIQRELREIEGLTVLVYDQTCAAEKRRRRKRGTFPDPDVRPFINTAVCEGCGDCTVKSNCVAVQPVETALGRKRRIDQSACNKDLSCVNGFCPSFVTVAGARPRRQAGNAKGAADPAADLPLPALAACDSPYGILVTGIGGTGVITIGALLGMAAHLEGKNATVLDSTGLAQKNGAVMSHIRIAAPERSIHSARLPAGGANLLIGCDLVVATSPVALATLDPAVTRAIVDDAVVPTAALFQDRDFSLPPDALLERIAASVGAAHVDSLPATRLATGLLGDAIATNLFMVGYAFQKGLLPVGLESIERAIVLNGQAIPMNQAAFAWGRRAAADPDFVAQSAGMAQSAAPAPQGFAEIVAHRVGLLTAYQDAAYAARYKALAERLAEAERAKAPGRQGLAETVARNLARLMAYKDEYEVARLYADPAFKAELEKQFEGDLKLTFHLAPPLLARPNPATGEPRKMRFGGWMMRALPLLARFKGLRGTAFDPFGRSEDRMAERRLRDEYIALVEMVIAGLTPDNHATALELLGVADGIRGYGPVKARAIATAKTQTERLRVEFGQVGVVTRMATPVS